MSFARSVQQGSPSLIPQNFLMSRFPASGVSVARTPAKRAKKTAPAPCCMCGRPLGCKRKNEKSDGRVDCDHVSGLSTRRHDRWPRWVPRSSPKHGRGFASRCNKRVFWIVGSTDRHLIQLFHPGINARFRRHRLLPVGRDARHRDPCQSGHLVAQSRPKPRGGSPVMPQPPRR